MVRESDIEEIIVSIKCKGTEKRMIFNTDKTISDLMNNGTTFSDFICDMILSMKKEIEQLKSGE